MSETRSRPVLAQISPNRVSKTSTPPSSAKRKQHISRLPRRRSPRPSTDHSTHPFMDDSDLNDTQTSLPRSDASNISNLSLLSDHTPTDDLGRRILEHARWTKHAALESGAVKMQPFARARPGPSLGTAMGDFQLREEQESRAGPQATQEADEVRPTSPNVPRQWGTKGRQRNDFLRRLTATTNPPEQLEESRKQDEPGPRSTNITARESDGNILAAEDAPLPSVETESPARGALSRKRGDFGYRHREQLQSIGGTGELNGTLDDAGRGGQTEKTTLGQAFSRVGATGGARDRETKIPRRQGSRDLLRQLARAASSTPSPTPEHDGRYLTNVRQLGHQLPTPPDDSLRRRTLEPKTPIVTGAWVDTPASRTQQHWSRNQPANFQATQPPVSQSETVPTHTSHDPSRPKSALEAILRSGDDDLVNDPLGESTIASLKDLVAQDDAGELSTILRLDEDTLNLVNNVTVPVQQGQELRLEEKEALRRMGEALKSARTGLRDASKGIKRVEHQVEQVEKRQNRGHSGGACAHCGCPGNATLSGILARAGKYFLSYFYSRPKHCWPRLTWLGLFTLILVTWLTSEYTLCEYYCHPLYANSMVGYGVDFNAPRMPYVTTTIMFKRPFGWIVGPFWKLVRWMVSSTVQSIVSGITDNNYGGGTKGGTAAATGGTAFGKGSPGGFGHDVGFGQDEVI